jgi:hypothetical protein
MLEEYAKRQPKTHKKLTHNQPKVRFVGYGGESGE